MPRRAASEREGRSGEHAEPPEATVIDRDVSHHTGTDRAHRTHDTILFPRRTFAQCGSAGDDCDGAPSGIVHYCLDQRPGSQSGHGGAIGSIGTKAYHCFDRRVQARIVLCISCWRTFRFSDGGTKIPAGGEAEISVADTNRIAGATPIKQRSGVGAYTPALARMGSHTLGL